IARNTGRKTDAMVGSVQRVLVDRESTRLPGHVIGIAENTRWVHFPGDASLIGRFADVRVEKAESINALSAGEPLWIESDLEA
ncbi:TRAM domain-containing protein, partial [Acinetobacter baumannii]